MQTTKGREGTTTDPPSPIQPHSPHLLGLFLQVHACCLLSFVPDSCSLARSPACLPLIGPHSSFPTTTCPTSTRPSRSSKGIHLVFCKFRAANTVSSPLPSPSRSEPLRAASTASTVSTVSTATAPTSHSSKFRRSSTASNHIRPHQQPQQPRERHFMHPPASNDPNKSRGRRSTHRAVFRRRVDVTQLDITCLTMPADACRCLPFRVQTFSLQGACKLSRPLKPKLSAQHDGGGR